MAKKKKSRLARLIRWLIVLAVLGAVGAAAWFVGVPSLIASVTVTYDAYTATTGSISNALSFSGSVSVINSGYATASQAGTVRTLYVKDGDTVKAGDKIARLSSGETVKADFDGTVNDVLAEVGDSVSGGGQIVQLVDFSNMKVTMRVDEYDISSVHVGDECVVTFTALEKSFPSVISHINRLSQSSGSVAYYTVTATVEVTEDVLPGMQVTVQIPKESATNVVVLKKDALSFARDNRAFVYVRDENGELNTVNVTLGVDNDNYVEIKSGLKDGDVVYVEAEPEETGATGLAGLISNLTGGRNRSFNMPASNSGFGNRSFGGNAGSFGGNAGNFGGRSTR